MDRLSRRLIASGAAAALLITAPGLPCYQAAAGVVAARVGTSSLGATAGTGAAGAGTVSPDIDNSGLRPVLRLDFSRLAAAPSASVPGIADLPTPTPEAAIALAMPALAAPALTAAEKPASEPAPAGRFQEAQDSLVAFEEGQDLPGIGRTISDPQAAPESAHSASARVFDAQRPAPGADPVPAASGLAKLGRGIAGTLAGLHKRFDLAAEANAEPEPPAPPPPATRAGKALQSARTGLAALLGAGLGIGFLFSGAAVTATAALWSPLAAAIAGGLGLAALAVAAKKRFLDPKPASRRKSVLPPLLAGAGLFLAGAAAAPALAGLVGLTALHIGSVGLLVSLALLFEFLNGMHDAANSIATVVATKTLTPRQAVLWAAFFNSIAYFFFGAHIATTIGSGLVSQTVMSNALLAAALLGASLWNWITVRLGIPVSSSHSLIGGLVGAALVAGGVHALVAASLLRTALFMVVSPVVGLAASFALMAIINRFFPGPLSGRASKAFGGAQLASSAFLSLGHGGNDSQKTIGIITALLFANGFLGAAFHVPWFVAAASYLAMGLGTMMGGWRIIKTLGEKVTKLDRSMGTAAEVGAGAAIMLSTWLGVPVSTTHVVTGSVTGVGAAHNGAKSVKWGTLAKIAYAWVLTIPFAALASGLLYLLFTLLLRAA